MDNVGFLLAAILLVAPTTLAEHHRSRTFGEDIQQTFASGYNEIMAADLSPACQKMAITNLAEAANVNANMTCNTTMEIIMDVGSVLGAAVTCASNAITDLNTLLNGIPMCWHTNSWYNLVGLTSCIISQATNIWHAIMHAVNFSGYYYPPIQEFNNLMDCLNRKNHADNSVANVLLQARTCK